MAERDHSGQRKPVAIKSKPLISRQVKVNYTDITAGRLFSTSFVHPSLQRRDSYA